MKNNETIKEKLYFIIEQITYISEKFQAFKKIIKKQKPSFQMKNINKQTLRKYKMRDIKREQILKKARNTAHTIKANTSRTNSSRLQDIG